MNEVNEEEPEVVHGAVVLGRAVQAFVPEVERAGHAGDQVDQRHEPRGEPALHAGEHRGGGAKEKVVHERQREQQEGVVRHLHRARHRLVADIPVDIVVPDDPVPREGPVLGPTAAGCAELALPSGEFLFAALQLALPLLELADGDAAGAGAVSSRGLGRLRS